MLVFSEPTTSGRSLGPSDPQHRAERPHLDRIAQRRSGPVGLDVGDLVGRDPAFASARRITASCAGPFGAVSPLLRPS